MPGPDILLRETLNGGDISVERGAIVTGSGLETAAYLSLFGGNADDPGTGESDSNWWGNLTETDPARRYRSETEYLIDGLPAIPANLRRIESAAERDLEWMLETGVATTIEAAASMPGVKRLHLRITIDGDLTLDFTRSWESEYGD